MEKRVFAITALEGLSREEFTRLFLEKFPPVVIEHQPGIVRFSFDCTLPAQQVPFDGGVVILERPPFDGLIWNWYESMADATEPRRLYATPDSPQKVVECLEEFLGSLSSMRLEEHVAWSGTGSEPSKGQTPGVKEVFFLARRPDITQDEFRERYHAYGTLVREHCPAISRYVQNLVMEARAGGSESIEAITEMWSGSVERLRECYIPDGESHRILKSAAVAFVDISASFSVQVVEHIMKF